MLVIVAMYAVSTKPGDIIREVDDNTQQIEMLQQSQERTYQELRELNQTLSRVLGVLVATIEERTKSRYTFDDAQHDWEETKATTDGAIPIPERFRK